MYLSFEEKILGSFEPEKRKAELARIKQSGFSWIRQTFPWAQIEPQQGKFDWAPWDRIVQNSDDLHLMAVLDTANFGTPKGSDFIILVPI
jgi:beta-galactosidase GanA